MAPVTDSCVKGILPLQPVKMRLILCTVGSVFCMNTLNLPSTDAR